MIGSVSPNVINRMPKYLRCLRAAQERGEKRISSAQIAAALGTTASQVRQDLTVFGSYGSQGYGYNIALLAGEIERILGIDAPHEIAVVGVGGIGRALLEHMDFKRYHYHVTAAFDVNPALVGTTVNGVPVYHMQDFARVIGENPVDICMLTVPKSAAMEVARQAYACHVPALWNFSDEDLKLSGLDMVVQNVNFLDSLFTLTYYLEDSKITMTPAANQ